VSSDEQFDPEDFEGVTPKMANVPRSQVRKWEKQAKENAELQSQLAAMQRERAFIKAGIPEDGAGKYFIKGYDGPDDPDSIRQAAIEAGIIRQTSEQQQQIEQAIDGHEAGMQAASGQRVTGGDDLAQKLAAAKAAARQGRGSAAEVAQIVHEAGLVVEPNRR
jgi:hypothetical protein